MTMTGNSDRPDPYTAPEFAALRRVLGNAWNRPAELAELLRLVVKYPQSARLMLNEIERQTSEKWPT